MLKIGIHEGPCLAVMLNDRQDYFGQTVNIASRVQGLATSRAIFATKPVVDIRSPRRCSRPPASRRARKAPRSRALPAKSRSMRSRERRLPRKAVDGRNKSGHDGYEAGGAFTVFPGHLHKSAMMHFSHSGRRAMQV